MNVYCPECFEERDGDYCKDCGSETEESSPENVNWPIEFTYTMERIEDVNVGYKLQQQIDASQALSDSFKNQNYYISNLAAIQDYRIKIYRDGTYDVEEVSDR